MRIDTSLKRKRRTARPTDEGRTASPLDRRFPSLALQMLWEYLEGGRGVKFSGIERFPNPLRKELNHVRGPPSEF
jgi:hypothetical protein